MTGRRRSHCRHGHPFDEDNSYLYHGTDGRLRRVCRKCAKLRNGFRERLYGLSTDDYSELVEEQNGVCALCGKASEERAIAVDHDHASGEIRGLLCSPCNTGVGMFRDDPGLLRKAIAYIEAHRRGQAFPLPEQRVMSAEDRDQISAAFEMLLDAFMTDIEALAAGRAFTDTLMWTFLPDAFADRYDIRFALKFLVGTARVRDRIADGSPFPATSVGEELALHAVIRTAIINVTEAGDLPAARRLEDLGHGLLPDLDFLVLFEREFRLSREQAQSLGVVHLWLEDWFRPFDQDSPMERSALN